MTSTHHGWVIGAFAWVAAVGLGGPELPHTEREELTRQVKQLERSCTEAKQCFATGYSESWCPPICNECGFVLNHSEKTKFEALRKRADKWAGRCPVGKCVRMHCEVSCDAGACGGKSVRE